MAADAIVVGFILRGCISKCTIVSLVAGNTYEDREGHMRSQCFLVISAIIGRYGVA